MLLFIGNLLNIFELIFVRGHDEIANILINAGSDINLQDLSGNTSLHYAVLHSK